MKSTCFIVLFALFGLVVGTTAEGASLVVDTIALTGVDDARGPNLGPGVTFTPNGLGSLGYGPDGRIAFGATIAGGSTTGALYSGTLDNLAVVAAAGETAPGIPGATFDFVGGSPSFLNDGSLIHGTVLAGAGINSVNNDAIYRVGGSAPVMRKGDIAPNTNPFTTIGNFGVGTAGDLLLSSMDVVGPGIGSTNDRVLHANVGSGFVQIVREGPGFAASGLNPSEYYSLPGTAQLGPANGVVFQSEIFESVSNAYVATGLFHWDGTDNSEVLRTGGSVAGTDGVASSVSTFSNESRDGKVAVNLILTGGTVTSTNDRAYYLYDENGLSPIVREGDAIAAIPGTTIATLQQADPLRLGSGDVVSFTARVNLPGDPNNTALLLDKNGVRTPVVVGASNTLPGLAPGEIIHATNTIGHILSDEGAVAFSAIIDRPTGTDPRAVWYRSTTGDYSYLLNLSEQFDVDPNAGVDLREISTFQFGKFISDTTFLSTIFFTDGSSGVFSISVVPEPASVLLFGIASLTLVMVRRRTL